MKIVFLEVNTLGKDVTLERFKELGDVVTYPLSDPAENANRIKDADIVVVNKIPVNDSLLKDAPNVKLVCLTATGTNNVDFDYTNSKGIAVANVRGYSTESVVQHTFAMLFYLYEKLSYYDNFVKSEEYVRNDVFSHFTVPFRELCGKTWGIIGLGTIGMRVAETAKAFGCKVIYYSTSGKHDCETYERKSLEDLLKESDIVSIHAPLNADTFQLMNKERFALMKKEAILLNLGRGPIIKEDDLAEALQSGMIAGAGLDVLCAEPMAKDNPLIPIKDSTKLLITPHIAWATVEARQRCADEVYENIKAYFRGEKRNIVTA
ncbi:MAG: D-2-hydroxyacid dehydrogenase [Lachnospiraceae bacterium]|nr:D-2-hydroxyacid dehydrogenase [Lachnospiraceae bacterium]